MLWYLLGFLSFLLDESDVAILTFLPRGHRSLRDYVGDSDVKAGIVLLVALPPGLPGMSADPTVTRFVDLIPVRITYCTVISWCEPLCIAVGTIGSQSFHHFP